MMLACNYNWHCSSRANISHWSAHLHETINLLTHTSDTHLFTYILLIPLTNFHYFQLITTVQGVVLKEATDIVCHYLIVAVINITWLVFCVSPVPTRTFILLMFTYSIWKEKKITILLMCPFEKKLFIRKFIQTESDAHFGMLHWQTVNLNPGKINMLQLERKKESRPEGAFICLNIRKRIFSFIFSFGKQHTLLCPLTASLWLCKKREWNPVYGNHHFHQTDQL